ncbi:MAG: histidine phosphatase family protein [Pontiellaceae bacterium]
MKNLYFIRHAQSEANLNAILASQLDFPLSEVGRNDAIQIATKLPKIANIDCIISSPLIRSIETASPIAKQFNIPIETDKRIIEQDLGIFSGMSYKELEHRDDYMHDRSNRWNWVPKGGESYKMVAARVASFFKGLDEMDFQSILCVTHAVTMRLIKAQLQKTLPKYPLALAQNGEMWKCEWNGFNATGEITSFFLNDARASKSRA